MKRIVICLLLGLTLSVIADPYRALVEVAGLSGKETASNANAASHNLSGTRPLFEAKASELLRAQWSLKSNSENSATNVLVHFFVARAEKAGQLQAPDLRPERVVVEGALTMDFKNNDRAEGHCQFRLRDPGIYQMRLEARGTAELFEPVAVLDLEVR